MSSVLLDGIFTLLDLVGLQQDVLALFDLISLDQIIVVRLDLVAANQLTLIRCTRSPVLLVDLMQGRSVRDRFSAE
jgi:hypothetical protein